jgi:hypothetical protein
MIDLALGRFGSGKAKRLLDDARERLVVRFKDKLANERVEVLRLASGGEDRAARDALSKLARRFPRECEADLKPIARELDKALADRAAEEQRARVAAEEDARRREEQDRYGLSRAAIDKQLVLFEVAKARELLKQATPFESKEVLASLELDAKRIDGIAKLQEFALEGYKAESGTDIELERRAGPKLKGKLLRIEEDKLVVHALGGEVLIGMGELAPKLVLLTARRGAKKHTDEYGFARAVLLACQGDKAGALQALETVSLPEADLLRKQLKSEERAPVASKPEEHEKKPTPTPTPSTPDDPSTPPEQGDDARLERALAQKLKVRASVRAGVADFTYNFQSDDQLLDWKQQGFDLIEPGSHEILARIREEGLLLGASTRGAGLLTHGVKLKGDYELEVRMMFNQMAPSAEFVVFFGERNGRSTGVSFGQQLVKVSGGVKPLAGSEPDRGKWASEKNNTFRIVRRGDTVEVTFNGVRTAQAKGDFDGGFGILASGVRCIVSSLRVRGGLDPAQF